MVVPKNIPVVHGRFIFLYCYFVFARRLAVEAIRNGNRKRNTPIILGLDCFVASLLAMTVEETLAMTVEKIIAQCKKLPET